jgi:hypothetical protein
LGDNPDTWKALITAASSGDNELIAWDLLEGVLFLADKYHFKVRQNTHKTT